MSKDRSKRGQSQEMIQAGYRYALALTHHHYDAEDLVQQAWMKCHHRYGTVKNQSMLYTTIRNLFYDQCRRGKIIAFESIDDEIEPPDQSQNEAAIAQSMDLDILLAHLRSEEREALYLNAVEGHTAQEIAQITGSPRNTILSLIHRARKKLIRLVSGAPEKPFPENQSHE
ncbi:RNA polymerase sigma factor [Rubellicoccus peritrichatus]|uniref:RNA polymerase sigma factor n=1 Tax=Rubellicoccus peritrichatus TaxID=3080537 RepID=A0AAQ3L9L8_9BACT|nr:RNA polymerase sigma factor [Puniceicoccus sp. CR14]WOO41381.1 RNA polymerase sigma factor [Puniceicoccus sp. CR14]